MIHKVSIIYIRSPLGDIKQLRRVTKEGDIQIRNCRGVSETIEDNETPLQGALRGLYKECNLSKQKEDLTFLEKKVEIKRSPSNNKLKTYIFYIYKITINKKEAESINLLLDEGSCYIYFKWSKRWIIHY